MPHNKYAVHEIEIRKRLHSQIVFGVGTAALIVSYLINPNFLVPPNMTFVPVTLLLCAVCGAISFAQTFGAIRLLSMSYTALLACAFRIQLSAMGELGTYWAAPVTIEIILATAFVFNSRNEYLISCTIAVAILFVGQPASYFTSVSISLLSLSIASSVLVGYLLNHAVMTCLRELYASKERFKILSSTDTLTGISNRRAFMQHLESALASPHAAANYFAMVDIDDFKSINDSLGHEMGDRVLIAFANHATKMSSAQIIGRLGGEEFGILLQAEKDEEAMAAMETLLEQVRQVHTDALSFSFSAGLLRIRVGDQPTYLLRKADEALYHAKREGKGRILWAKNETQCATNTHVDPAQNPTHLARERAYRRPSQRS
ncbi:GGDEF domain-containing protein (plasmid) [Rhizobium sp. NIBRBAC000502774]|nr:GGDEF domain-containing protein [Rhizobium sp. NIBRBAC000502774]